jgi:hypothetical protein
MGFQLTLNQDSPQEWANSNAFTSLGKLETP